jgi:hypothetical protein
VKYVSTVAKGNAQAIVVGWRGVGLVLNRGFIERIAANGALKFIIPKTKQKMEASLSVQLKSQTCLEIHK